MFAFSNIPEFFGLDPIKAKIVHDRRAIYIGRKNNPSPINGVDLSKDIEFIEFSIKYINDLIQGSNSDDFLVFRFICDVDLSRLSIVPVIMEKNSRAIKRYLGTDPTAMLSHYQLRKYLLKDNFPDDCDGIAHKVSDYQDWLERQLKTIKAFTAILMIDNSFFKPKKVNIAITNSDNITEGTRAVSIDDYLLNTDDEFSDNGTECCPPR